jgi:hypothetical protein
MKRRQGFSLGNTIVVIAVVSTLAFTIAAASLNHLSYSNRVSNGIQAQNIAESVMALATEKLLDEKQEHLGELHEDTSSLTYDINGGQGIVTFNKQQADLWRLPFSTNNLFGDNPVPGYDATRPIPKNSAQLIARGTYAGVSRQVECILYIPPFPYAVATAGPFHSKGKLEVGALDVLLPPGQKPSPEDILSANLASNSADAKAMVLGPESRISGDVRAAGAIETDKTVYVGGRIRAGADPIAIPKESVTSYDPEASGKPNLQRVPPGYSASPNIAGFAKCTGDLNITGGLKLDSGVLYVDGNLNVDGGISGKGALFVTKGLNLVGSTRMETDNKVAVLAGGNVTIFGSGQESSLFQGMLYNEGAFSAQHITLMGVFIQNKEGAPVEISDSSLYYQSSQSKLDMTVNGKSSVDVTKANISISALGMPLTGAVTGSAVFEVYPTTATDKHWEVVDPNSGQIYSVANKAAVRSKIMEIWKAYGNSTKGGLVGMGPGGSGILVIPSIPILSDLLFWPQYDNDLNNIPAREAGASQMMTRSNQRITVDPTRFLSLKDRVRLLYWRAR